MRPPRRIARRPPSFPTRRVAKVHPALPTALAGPRHWLVGSPDVLSLDRQGSRVSDRVQGLIDAGRLAREPAPDDEITGLWTNALRAHADAGITAMSPNGRLVRAYDAGRIAATAVVRARDPRPEPPRSHPRRRGARRWRRAGNRAPGAGGARTLRRNVEYGRLARWRLGPRRRARGGGGGTNPGARRGRPGPPPPRAERRIVR